MDDRGQRLVHQQEERLVRLRCSIKQCIAVLPSLSISPKERAKGQKQDKGAVAELIREAPPPLLQPRGCESLDNPVLIEL